MKTNIINKLNYKKIKKFFNVIIITIIVIICNCILIFVIIYIFKWFNNLKEGFQWSQDSIDKFKILQSTINPQSHFNMQMIQKQASEEEGKELLKTGVWPWSKETEYLYMDAVDREPIVRLTPGFSMQKAKTMYNENAIKQMISWNTKEGQFLLNGSYNKNKNDNNNNNNKNTIKCFSYVDKPSELKKIQIDGLQRLGFTDLLNGYKKEKIIAIENENVPNEMPGFSFIGKPCNPCAPLDNDYSCPFRLNVKGDDSVSDIWKTLWNI
jgi:hypothetical protein